MALRLNIGVDPRVLRNYGFSLGHEHFGKEHWCGDGTGFGYQAHWWHKFLRIDRATGEYTDDPAGEIAYCDDGDSSIPMIHLAFKPSGDSNIPDTLYIECAPYEGSYEISGGALDLISDTVARLVADGVASVRA